MSYYRLRTTKTGPEWGILYDVGGRGTAWLAEPSVALISILIVDVWQWTPFMILIVLAGLQAIP